MGSNDLRIGIIGAMDIEVEHLHAELQDCTDTYVAGMRFASGLLSGVPVVVVQCGMGKVNAAICVQVLVDRFDVTHVVNTGAAGSLDARIDIGDVVVSTECINHDVDATYFGYAPGQVPGMPSRSFVADSRLCAFALSAVEEAAADISSFEGAVVSGDQFICDAAVKQRLIDEFGGMCCEMEGAAVAQAATRNGVPFVIVRVISDKADGSDSEEYDVFEKKAAHDSAHIVERMVGLIAQA